MSSRKPAPTARTSHLRFVTGWSLLVLALLASPAVVGIIVRPAGTTFTWVFVNPSDAFVYLTQMAQGSSGHWDFVDVYSARHLAGQPIFLFYSLVGHLLPAGAAGPAGLGLLYQATRLVFAALFLWQLWGFLGDVCPSAPSRRVAFLLAVLTAGFGVYELVIPDLRATRHIFDLVFDESSSFAGMMAVPHHAAFLLLLAVFLRALVRILARPQGSWPAAIVAALAAAGIAMIHPDKAVVTIVTVLVAALWSWYVGRTSRRNLLQAAIAALGPLPYVAALATFLYLHPELALLDRAGNAVDPNPLFYLLGFGPTGLVVLATVPITRGRVSKASTGQLVAWAMVIGAVVDAALPSKLVDHQLEGLQFVLAALAGTALVHRLLPHLWRTAGFRRVAARRLLGYDRRRLRQLSINLFILVGLPSVLAYGLSLSAGPVLQPRDVYLRPGDVAATAWLRDHASPDAVVLATPTSARFVTAYAHTRVAVGDFAFTPNGSVEVAELSRFFTLPAYDRAGYLRAREVNFVYFGSTERSAAAFDPASLAYLAAVYTAADVTIYAVRS